MYFHESDYDFKIIILYYESDYIEIFRPSCFDV